MQFSCKIQQLSSSLYDFRLLWKTIQKFSDLTEEKLEELRANHSSADEWITNDDSDTFQSNASPVTSILSNISSGIGSLMRKSKDYVVKKQTQLKNNSLAPETQQKFAETALNHLTIDSISQGVGVRFYRDGRRYEGNFQNGKRQGYGILYLVDESVEYEGSWRQDLRDGRGTGLTHQGWMYKGDWKADLYHGKGSLRTPSWVYSGEWRMGVQEGKGEMTFANGNVYDGEWHLNRHHGKGFFLLGRFTFRLHGLC